MRYIRDIINDKKRASEAKPEQPEQRRPSPEASSPLILSEPIFPDTPDQSSDQKEVSTSAAMPEPSPAAEASTEGAKVSQPAQAQPTQVAPKRVEATERQATQRRLKYRTPASGTPAQEFDVKAQDTDPFDKFREQTRLEQEAISSVSPLRPTPDPMSQEIRENISSAPEPENVEAEVEEEKVAEEELKPLVDALDADKIQMPKPSEGRGSKVSARVKTRLLGFSADAFTNEDPLKSGAATSNDFPVGWLVVVSDKGRGKSFALGDGVSSVGRGSDQTICLDFGDNSISRENHISIAFDAEQGKFFVGHGGKTNLVRVNNKPLLSTEELNSKDMIRLGETSLRFIAFCDDGFSWEDQQQKTAQSA